MRTLTGMMLTALVVVSLRLWSMPPREAVAPSRWQCAEAIPLWNYCTNAVHPHYYLRSNTGATNGWEHPGGSVGVRMRR